MATFSDLVQRAIFEMDVRGVKQATDQINDNTRASEKNAAAMEANDRAQRNYEKSSSRASDVLHRMRMQTDAVYAATIKFQKALSAIEKQGFRTEDDVRVLELLAQKLVKAQKAANDNAAAFNRMADSMAKASKIAEGMTLSGGRTDMTGMTGKLSAFIKEDGAKAAQEAERAGKEIARRLAAGMSSYGSRGAALGGLSMGDIGKARAEQEAAARDAATKAKIAGMTASMSRFGGKSDFTAQLDAWAKNEPVRKAAADTVKLNAAMEANAAASKKMSDGLSAVGKKAAETSAFIARMSGTTAGGGPAGLSKAQKLTVQQTLGDVISSLSTGQSAQTILLQQGEQFLQPFGTGMEGIKNAASKLGPILMRLVLHPITLITAAVGASAYAFDRWNQSQKDLIVTLNGVGRASGATLAQINAISQRVGDASGISSASARGMAGTFLGAGVSGRALQGGMSLVTDFSKRLGLDSGDAAKQIAGALADPARGAEELAKQYNILTYAQQEQIRALTATGEKAQATARLIEYLGQSLAKMEDTTGFFTRQWEGVKKVVSDLTTDLGQFIERMVYGSKSFAQVAEEIKNAADALQQKEADLASGRLGGMIGQYAPDAARLKSLQEQNAQAQKDIGNPRAMTQLWQDGKAATDAVEALSNQLKNFKTRAQITAEQTETNVALIKEEDILRRAQLQGAQLYRDEMRDSGIEANAAAKQMGAFAEGLAQVRKAVTDLERQAKNQLETAGKSSIEQQFIRLEQEARDQARQKIFSQKAFDDRVKATTAQYQYDTFDSPTQDAEAQARMIGAQSATLGKSTYDTAFDSAYMEKYNQLVKDNAEITPQAVDLMNQYAAAQANVARMAEDAADSQRRMVDVLDIVRSTTQDIGTSLAEAFRRGENAGLAMLNVLDRLASKLLDKALSMAIDGLFGKVGTAGLGAVGKLFGFADGGIMTSSGPLPLMRYAGGGIADQPQIAMFGEGRKPEAFVPLPDGRAIPVKMKEKQSGAKVTVNNFSNSQVEARQLSDGEILVTVKQMIDANNRKVPGLVADAQRRSL